MPSSILNGKWIAKQVFWLGNLIYSKLASVSPCNVDGFYYMSHICNLTDFYILLLCLIQGDTPHKPKC